MFSSISSYFYGASEAEAEAAPPAAPSSVSSDDEGVMVEAQPSLNLRPSGLTMVVNQGRKASPPQQQVPSSSRGQGRPKKTANKPPHAKPSLPSSPAEAEDEWVMVGPNARNTPLTLGSLNEVLPTPTTGSTGSSTSPSESGDEGEAPMEAGSTSENEDESLVAGGTPRAVTLSRSARRLTSPFSCQSSVTVHQMKAMRSAQVCKQKRSAKSATAKAVAKKNKAVKNEGTSLGKRAFANKHHLSLKSAGSNKQLKQC